MTDRGPFDVAPIGSCRITTPLRLSQDALGFTLNRTRNYGYCHSPAEAVQQARFFQNEFVPTPEVWPWIARGVEFAETCDATHTQADLYVVELSSAKQISLGGTYIQSNYLAQSFPSFFEDHRRARAYWEAVLAADLSQIDDALGARSGAEDYDILRRVQLSIVTDESLRQDIGTLHELLPEVLIVTHADARKPDGSQLVSRSAFISQVKDAAAFCDAKIYDPTTLMNIWGQDRAIEDHSSGLAHFTEDFGMAVAREWAWHAFAPRIREMAMQTDVADSVVIPFATAVAQDNCHQTVSWLKQRPFSDSENTRIDKFRQALEWERDADAEVLSQAAETDDTKLLQTAFGAAASMGHFAVALRCAKTLDQQRNHVSPQTLFAIASHTNDPTQELAFLSLAANNPICSPAILTAFTETALDHAPEMIAKLKPATLDRVLAALGPKQAVAVWRMFDPDLTQLDAVGQLSLSASAAILLGLGDAQHYEIATQIADVIVLQHGDTAAKVITRIADHWANETGPDRASTIARLNATLAMAPDHRGAARAIRLMRKEIILLARQLSTEGNLNALDALAEETTDFPLDLPEIMLARARMHFAAGQFDMTVDLGQKAAQIWHDNISVWVLLMRAAAKADDPQKLSDFAENVAAMADADTIKFKIEAEKHLERLAAA